MDYKTKTLNHYHKMIKWAKTQNPEFDVNLKLMRKEIGEDWGYAHCPYCSRFFNQRGGSECSACPLNKTIDSEACCDGLWDKMNNCCLWFQWIEEAEKIINFIEING